MYNKSCIHAPCIHHVCIMHASCKLNNSKRVQNKYFDLGDRKINTILGSIRLRCSQLNDDPTRNNILNNNKCICGSIEAASHYLFE